MNEEWYIKGCRMGVRGGGLRKRERDGEGEEEKERELEGEREEEREREGKWVGAKRN